MSAAPSRSRSAELDALRAVAALAVLFFHADGLVYDSSARFDGVWAVRTELRSGVDLFFAISGLLIAGPFLRALLDGRPLPATRPYLLRRAARILPGYWLALAALILVVRPGGATAAAIGSHLVLVHDLVPGEATALYPVAWTLGIEALFYLAVPAAAVAAARRLRGRPARPRTVALAIVGLWAASAGFSAVVGQLLPVSDLDSFRADPFAGPIAPLAGMLLQMSLPATLCLFCPGMLVAVAEHQLARGAAPRAYRRLAAGGGLCLAAAVLLWVVAADVNVAGGPWRVATHDLVGCLHDQLIAGAAGLALVGALHREGWLRRPLAMLAPLGVVSYGIYLWQEVIALALELRGRYLVVDAGHLGWLEAAAVLLAATLPLAAASWFCVERPLMRLAARRRLPAPAALPARAPTTG